MTGNAQVRTVHTHDHIAASGPLVHPFSTKTTAINVLSRFGTAIIEHESNMIAVFSMKSAIRPHILADVEPFYSYWFIHSCHWQLVFDRLFSKCLLSWWSNERQKWRSLQLCNIIHVADVEPFCSYWYVNGQFLFDRIFRYTCLADWQTNENMTIVAIVQHYPWVSCWRNALMNMHALPLIIHQTVSTFKQHFFQV